MKHTDEIKIRVTPSLKEAFAEIADRRGATISKLLRAYMERVVKQQKKGAD